MLLKKREENCKSTQYHLGYTIKHTRKLFEHYIYAFEHHPQNNSIMPKIMLEKCNYAQLILAVFHDLFHHHRHKYNILLHQL